MPDAAWKAFERRVARLFGGKRRGPDVGGSEGGRSDVIAPGWSIEVKLLGRPGYADLLGAARQVCMRLETYLAWHVPGGRMSRAARHAGREGEKRC